MRYLCGLLFYRLNCSTTPEASLKSHKLLNQIKILITTLCICKAYSLSQSLRWDSFLAILRVICTHYFPAENMLTSFKILRCNTTDKLHFINLHIDYFLRSIEILVRNMAKEFTKTSKRWKQDTEANGTAVSWQILLDSKATRFFLLCLSIWCGSIWRRHSVEFCILKINLTNVS